MFQIQIHNGLFKVFHSVFGNCPKKFYAKVESRLNSWSHHKWIHNPIYIYVQTSKSLKFLFGFFSNHSIWISLLKYLAKIYCLFNAQFLSEKKMLTVFFDFFTFDKDPNIEFFWCTYNFRLVRQSKPAKRILAVGYHILQFYLLAIMFFSGIIGWDETIITSDSIINML